MSVSDKVELVEKHKDKYGLNMCCRALGLSKGTLAYRRGRASCSQADAQLKAEIVTTIRRHPDYGYRRIKEDIKARTGIVVNHKRLRKLLSTYGVKLASSSAKAWQESGIEADKPSRTRRQFSPAPHR